MKIIFSPSKEMREENIFENKKIEFTESKFKDKTNILIGILKEKSLSEIENIMKLKGELLNKTYKDIQNYDKLKYIPAISMYYGVSFKELELEAYSEESLKYLKDKLFILSALYGLSKPFDLVKKYRLDMTMPIVDKGLPACFIVFALRIQFFRCIKGIVRLTLVQKQLGILGIDCLALTLAIGGMRASLLTHAFVIGNPAPFKGFHNIRLGSFHIAHLVGILNTQEKISPMFFSK